MEDWSTGQVTAWLSTINGFTATPSLLQLFEENGISGDVLADANHDMFKEIGIDSFGQRVILLKAIAASLNSAPKSSPHPQETDGDISTVQDHLSEMRSPPGNQPLQWSIHSENPFNSFATTEQLERLESMVQEKDSKIARLHKAFEEVRQELTQLRMDVERITTSDHRGKLAPNKLKTNDGDPERTVQLKILPSKVLLEDEEQGRVSPNVIIKSQRSLAKPKIASPSVSSPPSNMLRDEFFSTSMSEKNIIESKDHAPTPMIVIFPYIAERADELNVKMGDKVLALRHEAGWLFVEKETLKGWLPESCLLEVQQKDSTQRIHATILYDYQKQSDTEISVKQNDIVVILKSDDQWFLIETAQLEIGWVPAGHISLKKKNVPSPIVTAIFGNSAAGAPQSSARSNLREITMTSSLQTAFPDQISIDHLEKLRTSLDDPALSKSMASKITTEPVLKRLCERLKCFQRQEILKKLSTFNEKIPLAFRQRIENALIEIKLTLTSLRKRQDVALNDSIVYQVHGCIDLIEALRLSTILFYAVNYGSIAKELDAACEFANAKNASLESANGDVDIFEVTKLCIRNIYDTLTFVIGSALEDLAQAPRDELKTSSPAPSYSAISTTAESPIFPSLAYDVLIQRKDQLDAQNLEKYLSEEDCLRHLGYSKLQLNALPLWKLKYIKRKAGLI